MFANPPRYENSFYGPIDGILNCIFPVDRGFLVKPQAILRPSFPRTSSIYLPLDSQPHPEASRSSSRVAMITAEQSSVKTARSSIESARSVDSAGDLTLSRKDGGWESSLLIPDFLVVKATEVTSADIILALVESKLNDEDEATSINQVQDYFDALQTKNYSDNFVAFLTLGHKTRVWSTQGQGNGRVQVQHQDYITTGDMPFCNLLQPLRRGYW